jgi:2,3-bisphosphoglycerate-dependent phosphoglycerate mutase
LSAATRILAIRHGETAWNAQMRMQGQLDSALNDKGRWQAQRLAQSIAGEPLAAIYSSDLARARETAQALAAGSRMPVQTDSGLRERHFGIFEGHSYADIARLWPDENARWHARDAAFGPEGGETLAAFFERSVACVEALGRRHRGQQIAVVSHGGVLDCLYRAAERLALDAPRSWPLGNASINRLLHSDQGFALVGWGDDLHLDAPAVDDASVVRGRSDAR